MRITALLTGKKNSTLKNKNEIKLVGDYIFNYPAKQAKKVKDMSNSKALGSAPVISPIGVGQKLTGCS